MFGTVVMQTQGRWLPSLLQNPNVQVAMTCLPQAGGTEAMTSRCTPRRQAPTVGRAVLPTGGRVMLQDWYCSHRHRPRGRGSLVASTLHRVDAPGFRSDASGHLRSGVVGSEVRETRESQPCGRKQSMQDA